MSPLLGPVHRCFHKTLEELGEQGPCCDFSIKEKGIRFTSLLFFLRLFSFFGINSVLLLGHDGDRVILFLELLSLQSKQLATMLALEFLWGDLSGS